MFFSPVTVRDKAMEQQAREELGMLESLYPDRFQYLKLELQSFISQPHHHHHHHHHLSFHSSMADTQESSSLNQRKRKKMSPSADEDSDHCYRTENCSGRFVKKKKKNKDKVDLLLERAEACLRKIRQFKASLLCNS
ncbi:uncharacterized protein LOC129298604 [Prosopis cineraria]|uniref:uncharacterized protein LOC129298604 n=1 Tax=Prosopis cineraria TaxID=364024 RepID=UPI0024109574|nr:uncharacterized protein LOC129298604 [Prosopis cineraria]